MSSTLPKPFTTEAIKNEQTLRKRGKFPYIEKLKRSPMIEDSTSSANILANKTELGQNNLNNEANIISKSSSSMATNDNLRSKKNLSTIALINTFKDKEAAVHCSSCDKEIVDKGYNMDIKMSNDLIYICDPCYKLWYQNESAQNVNEYTDLEESAIDEMFNLDKQIYIDKSQTGMDVTRKRSLDDLETSFI